jgi:hypothetical protein
VFFVAYSPFILILEINSTILEIEEVLSKLNQCKPVSFCLRDNIPKLLHRLNGKEFEVTLGSSKDFQSISISLSKSGSRMI